MNPMARKAWNHHMILCHIKRLSWFMPTKNWAVKKPTKAHFSKGGTPVPTIRSPSTMKPVTMMKKMSASTIASSVRLSISPL